MPITEIEFDSRPTVFREQVATPSTAFRLVNHNPPPRCSGYLWTIYDLFALPQYVYAALNLDEIASPSRSLPSLEREKKRRVKFKLVVLHSIL